MTVCFDENIYIQTFDERDLSGSTDADAAGHPIMGHRLGLIDPVAFLQRFPVAAIKVNYMRDMEFLQWHKEQISLTGPRTIYKQISTH